MDIKHCGFVILSIFLCACSSSGGDDPGTESGISGKTYQQAQAFFDDLRQKAYEGNTEAAAITEGNLQEFASLLLGEIKAPVAQAESSTEAAVLETSKESRQSVFNSLQKSFLSDSSGMRAQGVIDDSPDREEVVIDQLYQCLDGGSVRIKGKAYTQDGYVVEGAVDLSYDDCSQYGQTIDGYAAEYYYQGYDTYFYLDTLITRSDISVRVTGSVKNEYDVFVSNLAVTDVDKGITYQLLDWRESSYYYSDASVSGKLYHPELGFISVLTTDPMSYAEGRAFASEGSLQLTGNSPSIAELKFLTSNRALLAIDQTGDGQWDRMSYAVPAELADEDSLILVFSPYETPNFPPTIYGLAFESNDVNTTDPISVGFYDLYDPDGDEVAVSYEWKIDNVIHTEFTESELPALTAQKGQTVSVRAVLNDGHNEIKSDAVSLEIADAPATVVFRDLPESVAVGAELSFTVVVEDPDPNEGSDTGAAINLVYGPEGMSSDNGAVTWSPGELLFGREQTFYFGFSSAGHDGVITGSIVATDEGAKPLIARSGIDVPMYEHSISVGQFDADNKNEILLTDSRSRILTVEQQGDGYVQDWLYPYSLSGDAIRQVISDDLDNDGMHNIIALTEHGVFTIKNRVESATLVYASPQSELKAVAVLDRGGDKKLVVLADDALKVISTDGTLSNSTSLSNAGSMVLVGNVDNDSEPEIVVAGGYVYNSSTLQNEWYYPNGFGSGIALADVDNNGVYEILGKNSVGRPALFSAVTKNSLFTIGSSDNCSINAGNVDADPQDELLISDCYWGSVRAYDATLSNATVQWSTEILGYGTASMALGDADTDGDNEVLWGAGVYDSGKNILVVANAEGSSVSSWYNQNPSQLDSFVAAGMAQVTPEQQRAVFTVPDTDSGYGGSRVVLMNLDGSFEVSDTFSGFYGGGGHFAEVADYDQDGFDELFASASYYDGSFQVRQLNDFTLEWEESRQWGSNERGIAVADLNADSHADALYAQFNQVRATDVFNEVLLWSSPEFSSYVTDIAVVNVDGVGAPEILVSTSSELSVWRRDSETGSYSMSDSANRGCSRLAAADVDGDSDIDIFCLSDDDYYYSTGSSIIRFNHNLDEVKTLPVASKVADMIVETTSSPQKNLLIAANVQSAQYSYQYNSSIQMISAVSGHTIWGSQTLLGVIPAHSLYQYRDENDKPILTFATRDAMYLSQ